MLSPADEAVVLRDPALPGLALLLDDDALGDWLGRRLQAPVRVNGRYLRYKHGTSCVLAADVDTGSAQHSCLFSAYAEPVSVKVTKTVERALPGSVLGTEPARGLLVTTPGADRDLPALAWLDDPDRRERLLRRLLGDRRGMRGAALQTLRHKPHRRWVGLVQPTSGPPVVLRAYRTGTVRGATHAITVWGEGRPRTPRLLGVRARRGVAAVEYIDGEVLGHSGVLADDQAFRSAGAALAGLHSRRGVALSATRPHAETDAVRAAVDQLTRLLPGMDDDLRGLADAVVSRMDAVGREVQPIHGDFSADQVIVGDTGEIAFIDLDAARLGDPAVDLACAAGSLARDVVLGMVPAGAAERRLEALYAGYATVRPLPDAERIATHEAAHLLRRATEPFRLRLTPGWPDASRDLVARARRTLRAPTVAGGAP